jgi:hypothetical protein
MTIFKEKIKRIIKLHNYLLNHVNEKKELENQSSILPFSVKDFLNLIFDNLKKKQVIISNKVLNLCF